MKKFPLFSLALVTTCWLQAQSPITLGNANMPGSGDTLRYTNAQLNSLGSNYLVGGSNTTWNFSNLVAASQGVREFRSALQTPYFLFFMSPNEYGEKIADNLGVGPLVIQNYYNFYRKQNSPAAFLADGAGITFSNLPVPTYYSDKDELYLFPMTYPKYDSTTFRFATPSTTLIPVRYSKTGYRVTKVDGWGTVMTPWDTLPCLRLVTTQYATDTVRINLSTPFPLPPVGYPNVVRSYQWLTLTSKIPMVEVSGTLAGNNFVPTQVRYRGYPKTGQPTGLASQQPEDLEELFPNPVRDYLQLPPALRETELLLYSAGGTLLRRIHPGSSVEHRLDLSDLPVGVYLLKAGTQSFRLVKADW